VSKKRLLNLLKKNLIVPVGILARFRPHPSWSEGLYRLYTVNYCRIKKWQNELLHLINGDRELLQAKIIQHELLHDKWVIAVAKMGSGFLVFHPSWPSISPLGLPLSFPEKLFRAGWLWWRIWATELRYITSDNEKLEFFPAQMTLQRAQMIPNARRHLRIVNLPIFYEWAATHLHETKKIVSSGKNISPQWQHARRLSWDSRIVFNIW